eukprot:102626-Rhodomonas_salina.2
MRTAVPGARSGGEAAECTTETKPVFSTVFAAGIQGQSTMRLAVSCTLPRRMPVLRVGIARTALKYDKAGFAVWSYAASAGSTAARAPLGPGQAPPTHTAKSNAKDHNLSTFVPECLYFALDA